MKDSLTSKSKLFITCTIFILLWISSTKTVNSQVISLKDNIDSNNILIGDWINYSLELKHAINLEVIWPIFTDTTFGKFDLIDQTEIDTVTEKDLVIKKQIITLTSFDSGQKIIPALRFLYRKKGDTSIKVIITDTFLVNVSLVKVDTSKAIKPIKAPMKLPLTFRELLPYILFILGLMIIGFLIYYYIRKRKNKPILVKKKKSKLPPHVLALQKLKKLEEQKLWQKGEVKKYHIIITEIIREYIESRYEILALESTTEDILSDIKEFNIESELLNNLKRFLELSDLVKFAKLNPLPDDSESCLKVSYEFIDKTKPVSILSESNNKIDKKIN